MRRSTPSIRTRSIRTRLLVGVGLGAVVLGAVVLGAIVLELGAQSSATIEPQAGAVPPAKPDAPREPKVTRSTREAARPRVALPAPPEGAEVPKEIEHGVAGWVVTSNGDYVGGAQVGASNETESAFTTTGPDGRFELRGFDSKAVNVFATAEGKAADHARRVRVGTSDVMLVVDEPASVHVTVEARGLPHLFVRLCHHDRDYDREVCVKSEYASPPKPTYELKRLPTGEFDVVFATNDRELTRVPVRLRPGQELELPPVDLSTAGSKPG